MKHLFCSCMMIATFSLFISCKTMDQNNSKSKSVTDRVLTGGHCSRIDGGYENLIAIATAVSDKGEQATIIFGGGNHATDDLGATFPWSYIKNGKLYGVGFNDMTVAVVKGNQKRLFNFAAPFQDKELSLGWEDKKQSKPSALGIEWTSQEKDTNGRILSFTFNSQKTNVFPAVGQAGSNHSGEIGFQLFVNNTERVERHEGFKRKAALWDMITSFGQSDECAHPQDQDVQDFCKLASLDGVPLIEDELPGLALGEYPFILDQSKKSFIKISDQGQAEYYTIKSLVGTLERSLIDIIAVKNYCFDIIDFEKILTMHMQYDYLALFPSTPGVNGCPRDGFVGYISGLLNAKKPGATAARLMNDFVKRNATSGFFLSEKGEGDSINLRAYDKIKNVRDIEKIKEFNFATNAGLEYNWNAMPVGPGIFDRRIVELSSQESSCLWYGMLETQRLPEDPKP